MKQLHIRLFVLIAALAVVVLGTVGCVGEDLSPMATGLRLVKGPDGATDSVPQLVVQLDENGIPSVMGVTPEGMASTLATFGITSPSGINKFGIPAQAMSIVESQNVEHVQMVVREMADGRFIFVLVNGEEMVRLNWAARGMILESLKATNALPVAILNTLTQGLDALEATGDVDADFGVATHLYTEAIASGTATQLVWPQTQAEIDAEAEAAAQAEVEAAAQAAEDAGCFVTVASGDGPQTTADRVAANAGMTANQKAVLLAELSAQHATGTWFAGQTVSVSCPEDTPGPSGSELGGKAQTPTAAQAATEFVYIIESGPLPGETPAQAAARLAPQGGFDQSCLQAWFETGNAQGLFVPGKALPLPAACLDGN